MKIPTHTMTTADVARVLDLGNDRIRQLDDELEPIRLPNGARRYDPRRIESFAKKRARNVAGAC
jgi:hypothetical protein